MRRQSRAILLWLFAGLAGNWPASAQQRPLQTADAEILPAGTTRVAAGFDFLQDVAFPLSGLSGDLTAVGVIRLRTGVGRMVELQIEGAVRNFLKVKDQIAGPVVPMLSGAHSTHDYGDFTVATKFRLFTETRRRPAVAFLFGFQMPNSSQVRGIGTNTSNLFSGIILQKHFRKLNLFGNLGLAMLQSPTANFSQNDVLTYGAALLYPLHQRLTLAGEVFGRHSTRDISPGLIGTESRSQARLGVQLFAGGFQWDLAGIAGLTTRDAKTGFTFGVSKDLRLFEYPPK